MTKTDKPSEQVSPIEDITTAYRTLFVDLPLAEARLWMGIGSENEVLDAIWTEYDALSHLASAALDQFDTATVWSQASASGPADKKDKAPQ